VKETPYFKDVTEKDVEEVLKMCWEAEENCEVESYWGDVPTVCILKEKKRKRKRRRMSYMNEEEGKPGDGLQTEKELPTKKKKRKRDKATASTTEVVSSSSLFERLQSLLVEENIGDSDDDDDDDHDNGREVNDDDYGGDDDDSHEENEVEGRNNTFVSPPLYGSTYSPPPPSSSCVDYFAENPNTPKSINRTKEDTYDLSRLSLDQRTYVHLRAVQLVDTPFLPSVQPVVIEEEDAVDDDSTSSSDAMDEDSSSDDHKMRATKTMEEEEEGDEFDYDTLDEKDYTYSNSDDLDSVLRRMKVHLSELHRENNSRTASLQHNAKAYLAKLKRLDREEEENTALLGKYAQLVKRQKENEKATKKKNKGGEDWIPW